MSVNKKRDFMQNNLFCRFQKAQPALVSREFMLAFMLLKISNGEIFL